MSVNLIYKDKHLHLYTNGRLHLCTTVDNTFKFIYKPRIFLEFCNSRQFL